jgi:hypothetical protein
MFPCLHAVTGYVFLESLLHELKVLALDITGSSALVGTNYGIEISTKNRTKDDVVNEIANQLCKFFEDNFSKKKPDVPVAQDFESKVFFKTQPPLSTPVI